jgi:hypothetical protein
VTNIRSIRSDAATKAALAFLRGIATLLTFEPGRSARPFSMAAFASAG